MFTEGKITWDEAVRILENATAIIFEDTVTYFQNLSDEADKIEFCPEEDGDILTFAKEHNKEICYSGASLWLNEGQAINDSQYFKITILETVRILALLRNN